MKAKLDQMDGHGLAWHPPADRDALSSTASPAPTMVLDDATESPRRAPASVPVRSKGQDLAKDAAPSGGLQVFSVFREAGRKTHRHFRWETVTDLRDSVAKYSLGSS